MTQAPRWPWFVAAGVLGLAAFATVLDALAGASAWWEVVVARAGFPNRVDWGARP